jgi:rubrerythrin
MEGFDQARQHSRRKRKAESQDNERLSKRLSLLNIGEFLFLLLSVLSCVQCNAIQFDPIPVAVNHARHGTRHD